MILVTILELDPRHLLWSMSHSAQAIQRWNETMPDLAERCALRCVSGEFGHSEEARAAFATAFGR
jgi:hypothetical protein